MGLLCHKRPSSIYPVRTGLERPPLWSSGWVYSPKAGGTGSIPGQGTKILSAVGYDQKGKKKKNWTRERYNGGKGTHIRCDTWVQSALHSDSSFFKVKASNFWQQGPVSWKTIFPWTWRGDDTGGNVSYGSGRAWEPCFKGDPLTLTHDQTRKDENGIHQEVCKDPGSIWSVSLCSQKQYLSFVSLQNKFPRRRTWNRDSFACDFLEGVVSSGICKRQREAEREVRHRFGSCRVGTSLSLIPRGLWLWHQPQGCPNQKQEACLCELFTSFHPVGLA